MKILITGASAGIGEACARAFAAAKHDLVLLARRKERLTRLASELAREHAVKVDIFEHDVRSRAAFDKLISANRAVFDSIDVLINNAGLAKGRSPIQDGNPEDWDTMIDTNVKGLLYVTRALLPTLIARKGHIVNLGSVAGHWVYPDGNVYCATKYAVRALTESLRFDLHGKGVRVTEIVPGMVETEFSEVRLGDKARARAVYEGLEPLTGADIAEAILWCVQRPARVNIQELVIYPTAQASVRDVERRT